MIDIPPEEHLPTPTSTGEVVWLEPYPDDLLEGMPNSTPGPDAAYETREAVSLAFVTALQLLPPRQRTVLILRDVLGFKASETAAILEITEESVTSALKRARSAVENRLETSGGKKPPPPPRSASEHDVVARLTNAFELGDVKAIISLCTDDVCFTMPPLPLEYRGREAATRFLMAVSAQQPDRYRTRATRANGQPAFGLYLRDPHGTVFHAIGLMVVTLSGTQVSGITRFDVGVLPRFGLPRAIPE